MGSGLLRSAPTLFEVEEFHEISYKALPLHLRPLIIQQIPGNYTISNFRLCIYTYQLFVDNHLTPKKINVPSAVHCLAVSTDK